MDRRLYRSRTDRVIGGVAGGLAVYLGIDPSLVRVGWVILAFATAGFFALVYLVMLFIVPEEPESGAAAAAPLYAGQEPALDDQTDAWTGDGPARPPAASTPVRPSQPARPGSGGVIVGLILILVGGYFLLRQYMPLIDLDVIWPIVVIVIGVLLLAGALRPGRRGGG